MNKPKWAETVDRDFPAPRPVTETVREGSVWESFRHRGNVRFAMRKVYTNQEFQKRMALSHLPA